MKKIIREYFTFTKKERNGIIVLLSFLLILIIFRVYQSNLSSEEIVLMDEDFKKDIEEFEKSLTPKNNKENKQLSIIENFDFDNDVWEEPKAPFEFNPNKASKNEFIKLGFSEKQIETLMNYRKKGGWFFEKEDLLKIYGIDEKQYKLLEPYIKLEKRINIEQPKTVYKEKELVELNSASLDNLMGLRGIGKVYAERIIKHRDKLGGFYNKEQLMEVYGMDSSRYFGFLNEIIIDTNQIVQINLNEADFKTLIRHPYFNKYQTEAILKYKELEGNFSSIEQIYHNKLLTKEEYLKIKPYLKLK